MGNEKEVTFKIKILGTDRELSTIESLNNELKSINDTLSKSNIGTDTYKVLNNQAQQLTAELVKLNAENKVTQQVFNSLKFPVGSVAQMKDETAALTQKLSQSTRGVTLSNEEYDKYQAKIIENKKAIADFNGSLSLQKSALTDISSLIKAGVDVRAFENNSIKENRELIKLLTADYINLKQPTAEETEELKRLSDTLKEQESAVGNNTRNVGNYQGALKGATSEIRVFGVSLGSVETTFNKYNNALKDGKEKLVAYVTGQTAADGITKLSIFSTGGLAAAMNVLKLALIATGIGAFVVLLGSLIAAFATTEKGMDFIQEKATQVKVVFQAILGVAQTLGTKMIDIFKNPQQALKDLVALIETNLLNRLKSFGVILDGILNGDTKKITDGVYQLATGVTNLTDKIQGAAKETAAFLSDAAKKGKELFDIKEEIEDLEVNINKQRAETASRETELLLIAKAVTSTNSERKKAVDEILSNTKKLQDAEEAIVQKKIQALKLEQSLSDVSKASKKELADLEAELIKVRDAGKDKQLQLIKLLNKEDKEAIKAAEDAAKKKLEAQQKYLEDLAKLNDEFILNEKQRLAKSFDDKAAIIKGQGDQEIALRKAINDAKIKALAEFDVKTAKLAQDTEADRLTKIQQALQDNLQTELIGLEMAGANTRDKAIEIEESKQQAILENTKLGTAEKERLIAESEQRIGKIIEDSAKTEIEIEAKKREQMVGLITDYLNTIGQITSDVAGIVAAIGKLETDSFNKEIDERKSKVQELEQEVEKSHGRQKKALISRLEAEKTALAKAEKEKEETRIKYAKAQKAFAIIMAIVNTALAVISALATAPTIIAGVVFAALAAATGAAQIGIIAAQPLAKGGDLNNIRGGTIPSEAGIIQGPSHGQGGVKFDYQGKPFEAEGGEIKTNNGNRKYIFTKKVAQDPILRAIALATHNNSGHPAAAVVGSYINSFAGGRSFGAGGSMKLAAGGSLDSVTGPALSAPIIVSAGADPNVVKLIAEVNAGNQELKRYVDATNTRIDNIRVAVPVDQITDVQTKTKEVREASLF